MTIVFNNHYLQLKADQNLQLNYSKRKISYNFIKQEIKIIFKKILSLKKYKFIKENRYCFVIYVNKIYIQIFKLEDYCFIEKLAVFMQTQVAIVNIQTQFFVRFHIFQL